MRVVFFEIQPWERERLQYSFSDALLVDTKLNEENVITDTFKNAEVISTFIGSTITKNVIDSLPNLRLIATRSTGYDHIDVEYCRQKNIIVANVPEYGSNTVAEHTFALMLSLTRKIYQSVNQSKNLNFNHNEIRGTDLFGKTIGIVGLGKIGMNVLRVAQGFGMKVVAYSHSQDQELAIKNNFTYASLDELLKNADVITLHLPLNDQTKHILNKQNIMMCKKGSYLINTARGGLIETEAIVMALDGGIFEGVGLDVLEEEANLAEEADLLTEERRMKADLRTLVYNHMLINHPKVLITPHNAFNSKEALLRILETTTKNIQNFLDNKNQEILTIKN